MEYRNARYIEDGRIDCEINHPVYGWIPFTADPNDDVLFGRQMFEALKDIAVPYIPGSTPKEEPDRESMKLSFAQMLIGLVTDGWITTAEGRNWRDRISLPSAVTKIIESLPEEQQFAAETRVLAPSEVRRLDPLVIALGDIAGKSPEELDTFFITYSQI